MRTPAATDVRRARTPPRRGATAAGKLDMTTAFATPPDRSDFSMVLGGPLYQLFRRAHMAGSAMELLARRVLAVTLIGWLPLLLLAVVAGRAWGGVEISFLRDFDVHVRFLVSLPLLIY